MLVDETIVHQVLLTRKAYPSLTEAEIAEKVDGYFSKEELVARVETLTQSMVNGSSTGTFLHKFYPFLLFETYELNEELKLVLDNTDEPRLEIFREFCLEFGIPSHLKKHGSSKTRVFRMLPAMPVLELESIKQGEEPPIGWKVFCKYWIKHGPQDWFRKNLLKLSFPSNIALKEPMFEYISENLNQFGITKIEYGKPFYDHWDLYHKEEK